MGKSRVNSKLQIHFRVYLLPPRTGRSAVASMAGHLKQYRPCSNFPHFILHTYINTQTHTHTLSPLQTRIYICIHITHMYINKCNNTHGSHTNTLTHTHTILHCINKDNHTEDNPSKAIYTKRHTPTLNRNVQSLRRHRREKNGTKWKQFAVLGEVVFM